MKEITVIGSLNMDLVGTVKNMPKVGETIIGKDFKKVCGGKGANQAVAIGRLGAKVNMIGKVGEDEFGNILVKELKNNGIHTQSVHIQGNTSTGVALILVDEGGNNSITVIPGANFKVTREDINKSIEDIKRSKIVIMQLEIPLEIVKYSLKKAKELGKYTILNPAPAQGLDGEIIENVDLLIPNETELEILSQREIKNEKDLINAGEDLLKQGVKGLIVTLGEKGCIYMEKGILEKYPSYKVNPVDTTAAGDSFIGGLTLSLAEGKKMKDAIEFALKVGALTVTKEGAQSSLPYLEEVLNFKGEKR